MSLAGIADKVMVEIKVGDDHSLKAVFEGWVWVNKKR